VDQNIQNNVLQRLPSELIRRNLFRGMRSAYQRWNEITPFKATTTSSVTNQKMHIILSFITEHVFNAGRYKNASTECQVTRYQTLPWITTPSKIALVEQNIALNGDHLEIEKDAKPKIYEKDKLPWSSDKKIYELNPEFLIWLPNVEHDKELMLFLQFELTGWILDREIQFGLVEPYLEILLHAFVASEYLHTKTHFYSVVEKQAPSIELANVSKQLIYHEAWNHSNQQTVTTRDNWLDWVLAKNRLEFDSDEHDYLVATYLTCLMYTAKQGNKDTQWALARALRNNVCEVEGNPPLQVQIGRGPTIQIGPSMVRTQCVIAQVFTYLAGIPDVLEEHEYPVELVNGLYSRAARILVDIEKMYETT